MGIKAQSDVPKRITARQLTEQKVQELVVASQILDMPVTTVLLHTFVELITRNVLHNL